MNKEKRIDFQYYTAAAMLLAGTGLSIAGFIVPPLGEISNGVLLFFSQCLIYAGSIFGVGIYIQSRFKDMKGELRNEFGRRMTHHADQFAERFDDNTEGYEVFHDRGADEKLDS